MKKIFFAAAFGFLCLNVSAQTQVGGSNRSNGTYVQPHMRSEPNNTNRDNWSTTGNTNPYSGTSGSRAADYTPPANNYGQGQQIQTGPRGGQYYENSNGNKTYVPKR